MCDDTDGGSTMNSRFCGSYDYATSSVSTSGNKVCDPGANGDAVTFGYQGYSTQRPGGSVCTSGSGFY